MSPAASPCDNTLLQRSLGDELTEQQEEELAEHLAECAACRQSLEQLAADGDQWHRISSVLRQEAQGASESERPAGIAPRILISSHVPTDPTIFVGRDVCPADFAVDFLQPSSIADSIGQLADIQIKAVIGYGGNGIVLKGVQPELNRLVAVKVMAPHLATSAAARQRFAREAQATAAIVHPGVMPILSVNSAGQLPFLVMPYVDCESLQQRLDRSGALPVVDILRIALQVARGLQAAHAQGLVHRDVKPANILLERGVDRVMLTDFGLARAVDDASLTRTGLIAGTPQYMSPEQARGDSIDTRSDLFSLGSVLYVMSTGRPPFRAETSYGILRRVTDEVQRPSRQLNSGIPDWLEAITNRLLAKSAVDRFASAKVVAELLEDCLAHVQQPNAIPLPDAARSLIQTASPPPRMAQFTVVGVTVFLGLLAGWRHWTSDETSVADVKAVGVNTADVTAHAAGSSATPETLTAPEINERTSTTTQRGDDDVTSAALLDSVSPGSGILGSGSRDAASTGSELPATFEWETDPGPDIQRLHDDVERLLQQTTMWP